MQVCVLIKLIHSSISDLIQKQRNSLYVVRDDIDMALLFLLILGLKNHSNHPRKLSHYALLNQWIL